MTKLLAKQCQICSGDYEVKPADWSRGWGKCCSKACAATRREKIIAIEAADKLRIDNEKALIARLFHHEVFHDRNGEMYYRPKVISTGQVIQHNFDSLEKLYNWIRKNKKKNGIVSDVIIEDILLGNNDNLDSNI